MRANYRTSRASGDARTYDVGPIHSFDSVFVGATTKSPAVDLTRKRSRETPPPIADVRLADQNGDVRFSFDVDWDDADLLVKFFTGVRDELRNRMHNHPPRVGAA